MDQDKTGDRPQTLLEAAKATIDWWGIGSMPDQIRNLRAAIAREEAKPSTDAQVDYQAGRAAWWQIRSKKATDRAQQAEADAKWHREESARLSAELSLAKNQMTLAIERSERLSGKLKGCEYDLGQAGKLRQRAEKAEAEVDRVGKQLARLVELQVNPPIAVMQPFDGDPQTCAFGSNAFRGNREVAEPDDDDNDPVDPATGWTFATYRRVVEALGGES